MTSFLKSHRYPLWNTLIKWFDYSLFGLLLLPIYYFVFLILRLRQKERSVISFGQVMAPTTTIPRRHRDHGFLDWWDGELDLAAAWHLLLLGRTIRSVQNGPSLWTVVRMAKGSFRQSPLPPTAVNPSSKSRRASIRKGVGPGYFSLMMNKV